METKIINRIAVFCGSSTGYDPDIIQHCINLARELHANKITLVYGGGNVGLMGILADEMLQLGDEVIGVIPQKLVEIEVAHNGLSHLHIVPGMHERKALMAGLADAFIVLPGGIGTMEEFFEMFTWQQLGYHNKPVAVLNINGFYDQLIGLLGHMSQQGFVSQSKIEELIICNNSVDLINRILKSR